MEADEFTIEYCWESKMNPELAEKISNHWLESVENPGGDLNLPSQENALISEKIEVFHEMAIDQAFWHFILKRKHAVFEA